MDKLYTIVKFEYTKDIGKTFVNLYVIPDDDLILYFNNSPKYKMVRIHGYRDCKPIECNYYGTIDQLTCNKGSNKGNVISIFTSIPDIDYKYVSFPLADIKHELECLKRYPTNAFTTSNNPAQGYYDSILRKMVFPNKPNTLKPYSYIFKQDDYPLEQTCGKNGVCSINYIDDKPALYNIDDVTPIPYCSNRTYVYQTPLIENFSLNDDERCPCSKNVNENDSSTKTYSDGLIFFNKNKLFIYMSILMFLIIILCFLCFKKKRK